MILIISSLNDEHAIVVRDRLQRRNARVQLLDLSEFPQQLPLSIRYTKQPDDGYQATLGTIDLAACRVAWWRRPQPFQPHPDVGDQTSLSFVYAECHAAISGLWLNTDAFWINHPTRDDEAAHKVHQLKVAQAIGLEIPTTLITNDPARARAFVSTYGHERTIYKAFSGTIEAWRETRVLRADEVELLDNVRYAPVIFQEYIPAHIDLRITVVGDEIFPVAIYSQETGYQFDYRMEMDSARVEAFEIPEEVQSLLRQYMRRLGLVYGAIDMRLTPDGRYVFLEVNPSGQWLFVESRSNQPITDAMVDLMCRHDS